MVAEARPYAVLPHILVLAHCSTDPSFPSDHAVLAGAVAAGLWLVNRRLGNVAVLAAAAMAFARVYIGAHYTHDVLAGLAIRATVSLLGFWATRPILLRLPRPRRGQPVAAAADRRGYGRRHLMMAVSTDARRVGARGGLLPFAYDGAEVLPKPCSGLSHQPSGHLRLGRCSSRRRTGPRAAARESSFQTSTNRDCAFLRSGRHVELVQGPPSAHFDLITDRATASMD